MATRRDSKRRRLSEDELEVDRRGRAEGKGEKQKAPVIVFAHGAGAPSSSDWMLRWKDMLGKALNAVEVVTFDYPYMAGGKRGVPPMAEKLVDFHCEIVRKTMAKYPGHPLLLAGKSMGSRVSCMVAGEEDLDASAVICLGYPLKVKKGAIRDETLLQLSIPVMFVQGSKDGLCPLEMLEAVRKKMKSKTALHVIEGGDHSFKIAKKYMVSSQEAAEEEAVNAIAMFVSSCLLGIDDFLHSCPLTNSNMFCLNLKPSFCVL